jgi:hypothetical protein
MLPFGLDTLKQLINLVATLTLLLPPGLSSH